MYYSSGNYEAFARPRKPEGVERKSAWLVGSGLASLAAACFLVRDGQMKGENIHILEELKLPGGACDGIQDPTRGFVIRGGREMENHFECLWDLFRSIPSLEHPENSVLDEYYWLNKEDPNYSLCRATVDRGKDAHTDGKFTLSDKAALEIMKLFLTRDEDLYDRTITDVFTEEFFRSNFWLYWRTMFAFETWHSALEMKLYLQRFIHHIGGLPDFSALKFTQYNQYESLILPMVHYLKEHNVQFQYDTQVTNVIFDIAPGRKLAKQLVWVREGREEQIHHLAAGVLCITAKGKPIKAKTLGQKKYIEAIQNNVVTLGIGPAGTGKTYLAVAAAVAAFREKQVNRIILTRPAVEAGERLGFLPGDLQSKVDPYLRPLYDALFDMLGAETYNKYLERGNIEVAPLAYMRGRTLDDSFIILDEAQNTTPEQMKMFLTRMGVGSKVVVTGDVTQIDLPDKVRSGLIDALHVLRDVEGIAQVRLTEKDVVRHRLVQQIVKAYEKAAEEKAPGSHNHKQTMEVD